MKCFGYILEIISALLLTIISLEVYYIFANSYLNFKVVIRGNQCIQINETHVKVIPHQSFSGYPGFDYENNTYVSQSLWQPSNITHWNCDWCPCHTYPQLYSFHMDWLEVRCYIEILGAKHLQTPEPIYINAFDEYLWPYLISATVIAMVSLTCCMFMVTLLVLHKIRQCTQQTHVSVNDYERIQ